MKPFRSFPAVLLCAALIACSSDDDGDTDVAEVDDTDTETSETVDGECETLAGVEQLVCLADAFTSTLNSAQLATVQLEYNVEDAQKWSNLPPNGYSERVGAMLGDLEDEQRAAALALVEAAMSDIENEGYDEIEGILAADDYLADFNPSEFGSGNFFIALLGEAAETGTWQLYFGGHHLAITNTYTDGTLAGATPSFRAVEPMSEFSIDGESHDPMTQEQDALAAMLAALDESQLAEAELSETYSDILVGPQNDGAFPESSSGLAVATLSADQQALVVAAMATYVEDISNDNAAEIMQTYESELDTTYIAWSSNSDVVTQGSYVRIDGPSVWIEYSVQAGALLDEPHPHSVWRDKTNDYGGNL